MTELTTWIRRPSSKAAVGTAPARRPTSDPRPAGPGRPADSPGTRAHARSRGPRSGPGPASAGRRRSPLDPGGDRMDLRRAAEAASRASPLADAPRRRPEPSPGGAVAEGSTIGSWKCPTPGTSCDPEAQPEDQDQPHDHERRARDDPRPAGPIPGPGPSARQSAGASTGRPPGRCVAVASTWDRGMRSLSDLRYQEDMSSGSVHPGMDVLDRFATGTFRIRARSSIVSLLSSHAPRDPTAPRDPLRQRCGN